MIELKFAFTALLHLAPWRPYGARGFEGRRLVAVNGGTIRGPNLNGTVIPGGADWPTVHSGGILRFDARWTIETTDGALVYVQNTGIRRAPLEAHAQLDRNEAVDPQLIYFRTAPVFETAASGYEWMTQSLFVASGKRGANTLDLDVYEVR
jgi:hypothetical protein